MHTVRETFLVDELHHHVLCLFNVICCKCRLRNEFGHIDLISVHILKQQQCRHTSFNCGLSEQSGNLLGPSFIFKKKC